MSLSVRKIVSFTPEVWAHVEDYRFGCRISTESEAIRQLVHIALNSGNGSLDCSVQPPDVESQHSTDNRGRNVRLTGN